MSYEKNIKELEEIISKLEDRGTSLDDGIALYEQGIKVTKECMNALERSKGKITVLQTEMGKITERSIDFNSINADISDEINSDDFDDN